MKLTARILLLTGAALLPGILVAAYNEASLRAERGREVEQLAMRNTRQAAAYVEQVLQSIKGVLKTAAASPALTDSQTCQAYLAAIKSSLDYLGGIGYIDADGSLRCASQISRPVDLGDRQYFKLVRQERNFVVGEFVEARLTGRPLLMTAMPLQRDDRTGVVFASLDLNWLQKRLEASDIPAGAAVTIADRNGTIVARNPLPQRFIGTRIPDAFMHLVNADRPGTLELTSQDGTARILAYSPLSAEPVGLYVSSGLSKDEAFRAINRSTIVALMVTGFSAFVAVTLALALGQRVIEKPVGRILVAIERWRKGDRSARSGLLAGEGELGMIGGSLDDLLDELVRHENERDLLSKEIAHRIKNTLAIVQAIASQTIRGGSDGFSSFSMRLNALGRAYDVLLASSWQNSTLDKVVESATAPHQTTDRRISFEGDIVELNARAVLALTLVLHELCTNALKYGALSQPDGRVAISSAMQSNGRLLLIWQELGGPPVYPPARTGFGTILVRSAFPADLDAEVSQDFRREGVVCTIAFEIVPAGARSDGATPS